VFPSPLRRSPISAKSSARRAAARTRLTYKIVAARDFDQLYVGFDAQLLSNVRMVIGDRLPAEIERRSDPGNGTAGHYLLEYLKFSW
jgi:hypothetical protein